jgi:hypothetical protein
MPLTNADKLAILAANPHAYAVYDRPDANGPDIILHVDRDPAAQTIHLPQHLVIRHVAIHTGTPYTDLRLPAALADTICYNEPIPAGVQVQPYAQNWVGTLGLNCRFTNKDGRLRWGCLSCWHVLCPTNPKRGHPIHQPLDTQPAFAHLDAWVDVSKTEANKFDAALADAKIDNLHSVGPEIHLIGKPYPTGRMPAIGDSVTKSGRTTGLTNATCTAINAAVKVSYGTFTATFIGQAVFANPDTPFSAAGDSGSLILHATSKMPTALLFAGNDQQTIGSPIGPIRDHFNLNWIFPEP